MDFWKKLLENGHFKHLDNLPEIQNHVDKLLGQKINEELNLRDIDI